MQLEREMQFIIIIISFYFLPSSVTLFYSSVCLPRMFYLTTGTPLSARIIFIEVADKKRRAHLAR